MTAQLQQRLAALNEQWLVWNSAFLKNDRATAEIAIRDLLLTVEDVGMERLPEVSHGVIVQAVEAARDGDFARGHWALQMAELLDPGRPASAFAEARVAALEGAYPRAAARYLMGYTRLLRSPLSRVLWMHNLVLWLLCALVLTGGAYVAVQFATKGGRLYRDLAGRLPGFLPRPIAYLVALALLVWPFLLPGGWIWLVLYWAVLLWDYSSRSEHWVLSTVCLLFGVAPLLTLYQHRSVELQISDTVRAIDSLEQGSLYGMLLSDLGELQVLLPESNAVKQLIADSHVRLGQDTLARPIYRALSDAEPGNAAVLTNLGLFHLYRKEHFRAITFFKRAAEADATAMEPEYNLSQAYRELLEFQDADSHLERARSLDEKTVAAWVNELQPAQPSFGGLGRRREIEAELGRAWESSDRGVAPSDIASLVLPLLVPLCGLLLARVRGAGAPPPSRRLGHSFLDRLVRFVVPGIQWAEEERGVRAFVALLVPVAALSLPLAGLIGYRIPWGYDPGPIVPWLLAWLTLGLFYLVRVSVLVR